MEIQSAIETRRRIREALRLGYSFLLIGPKGVGKTDVIKSWASELSDRCHVRYLSLAGMQREDFVVPYVVESAGRRVVRYIPHELFLDTDDNGQRKPVLLILDEFNRHQDPQIYNILLEITHSHTIAGHPLNIYSIIGLMNPSDEEEYFHTVALESAVLDRFTFHFYVQGYDLGADAYLIQRFPDTGPAMVEWYQSLPIEKQRWVPPRRQYHMLRAFEDGFPLQYTLPRGVELPLDLLIEALRGGDVWTLPRLVADPYRAVESFRQKPSRLALLYALLRAVTDPEDAVRLVPLVELLPVPVRLSLLDHHRSLWEPVFAQAGRARQESNHECRVA